MLKQKMSQEEKARAFDNLYDIFTEGDQATAIGIRICEFFRFLQTFYKNKA